MSQHSIADARDHLSDLIDRALAGDAVVITREGKPVVEIRPVAPAPVTHESGPTRTREETEAMLAWLAARRTVRLPKDVVTLIREMRDEGP